MRLRLWLLIDVLSAMVFAVAATAAPDTAERDADDPGEPVQRIRVRALMIPPGIPDFFTRRFVNAGRVAFSGRAWSEELGVSSA